MISSHSRPKKSLGQNFLHDQNVVKKILRALHIEASDKFIEIGPGKGALTTHLLEILPHLTAIEIDNQLAADLQQTFGERLTLIHGDVLKVDLRSLMVSEGGRVRIVGNIPYNITSPILFWIIDRREAVRDAMLMMQREVAQRLIAVPRTKEYGILSVFAQYYAAPRMQFAVSPNSFFPVPDVISAVVHFDFGIPFASQATDDAMFRTTVRGTFGKRRKTLRNSLKSIGVTPDILDAVSIPLDQRPEELGVSDFVILANELSANHAVISLSHSSQE